MFRQILRLIRGLGLYAWTEIIWSPWNPWTISRLNLAWTKYTQTTMYEERKKIRFFDVSDEYEDYADQAYAENKEPLLFVSLFTRKEKLKAAFLPFSCGDRYKIPFWQIKHWIMGV